MYYCIKWQSPTMQNQNYFCTNLIILHTVMHMFQCYSLSSSNPLFSPLCPSVSAFVSMCLADRFISTIFLDSTCKLIPFYVIFSHIGIGRYDCQGYNIPYETVYEVALPAKKMKSKYLKGFEKDKNSGPIDFGPIIKFDRVLFEPMDFGTQKQEETDNVPLAIKALNINQNIIEEKGLE